MPSFPIFGTGGLWKAASGSGTPGDPFVPAVNLTAGGGSGFPLIANVDAAGFSIINQNIIQYQGTTLTHGSSPVGTPLTTLAGTAVLIDTSGGTVEAKLPAPVLGVSVMFLDAAYTWGASTFKMTPNGAETINGGASGASVICNKRGGFGGAYCRDGTNWQSFGNLFAATITDKSSGYTFVLADAGQEFTNSGASNTLTIDSNANVPYPFGTDYAITITNKAATALTIAKTGGATINGTSANRTLAAATTGVYATVSIWPIAADTWIMAGNFT